MKSLLASALFLTLSVPTFASTTDGLTVSVQNNQGSDSFSLNAETTRTEYRTETVETTCYRQVFEGYQTVCDRFNSITHTIAGIAVKDVGPHPDPGPHPTDPGSVPKPTPNDPGPSYPDPTPSEPVCHQEAVYSTEAYSCLETVSVPYEVFDHNSTANVNVTVSADAAARAQVGVCGINFTLTGDDLSATNGCSTTLATYTRTSSGANLAYVQNYNYAVKLFDADSIFAPLAGNLQNLKVDGDELTIKTGNLANATNFTLKLYVQRRKFLAKDVVLINRALTAKEFTFQAIDAKTGTVHINLAKLLNNFEPTRKNVIQVSLDVTTPAGTLLRGGAVTPNLHQENSITINK